jgi:hypothetical protein
MIPMFDKDSLFSLAIHDPIAAYGIALGIQRAPFAINFPATFTTFATDQLPLRVPQKTALADRTWVYDVKWSLQQPNVFNGNVFKTLNDAMLKAQPGVSVRVSAHAGPKFSVSDDFTPLENLSSTLCGPFMAGWQLYTNQALLFEYQLTQPPPATSPNGPPYNVNASLLCWQFNDPGMEAVTIPIARRRLREMGGCFEHLPDPQKCAARGA